MLDMQSPIAIAAPRLPVFAWIWNLGLTPQALCFRRSAAGLVAASCLGCYHTSCKHQNLGKDKAGNRSHDDRTYP